MSTSRSLLRFLSEEALSSIEETAYRLLDEVGISLEHFPAMEMLPGLGCRIEGDRTHVPHEVVRWALQNVTAGREFLNLGRSAASSLGVAQVRFHNGGGQPQALDLDTPRPTVRL